jgi:hypothetical protein
MSRIDEISDPEAIMAGIAFLEVNDFSEFRTHEPENTFSADLSLHAGYPAPGTHRTVETH